MNPIESEFGTKAGQISGIGHRQKYQLVTTYRKI